MRARGPSVHADGLHVVLDRGGEGQFAVDRQGQGRAVGGMDREGFLAVDHDRLHIDDRAVAETRSQVLKTIRQRYIDEVTQA